MTYTPSIQPSDFHVADALIPCFSSKPELTVQAASFSLQLSAAAYQMCPDAFQQQGWVDFSFQVDHTLMTGSKVNASEGVPGKISDLFEKLVRHRVRRSGPISQLYGTLRQRDKSDTCKAMVMAYPLSEGKFLIAIGFMGTGKRLFDWISNFRISKSEHMHQGFLQLTKEFERHGSDIRFPYIARQLGLERLTLDMVLDECRQENSRFLIWMSGHSQGGAIMQVFTHHLLQKGVLPQHLFGIGFASPTVIHDSHGDFFPHYPLYHLICADDLTPRIGAKRHLGTCYVLPMTHAMRQSFYGSACQTDGFFALLHEINQLTDTRKTLLFALGFLQALSRVSDKDASAVLSKLTSMNMPDLLLDWLGDGVSRMLDRISRHFMQRYSSLTGESGPPKAQLDAYERKMLALMRAYTPRGFAALLAAVLSSPHRLMGKEGHLSAYQAMTQQDFDLLRPMPMLPGAWPVQPPVHHARRRSPRHPRSGCWSLRFHNRR